MITVGADDGAALRMCTALALEVLLPVPALTAGELASVDALLMRARHGGPGSARNALAELHQWREGQWRPGAAVLHTPREGLSEAELLLETVRSVIGTLPAGSPGAALEPLAAALGIQGRLLAPRTTAGVLVQYGMQHHEQWGAILPAFAACTVRWEQAVVHEWDRVRHEALGCAMFGYDPFPAPPTLRRDRPAALAAIGATLGDAVLTASVSELAPDEIATWCDTLGTSQSGFQVAELAAVGAGLTLGQLIGLAAAVWR